MASEYFHMILSLLCVLLFIAGLLYLAKKMKFAKYAEGKHIKIINAVPIGAKEKILLLEVNQTFILIGTTPTHIETLYVFNELETLKTEKQTMPEAVFNTLGMNA